MRPGGHDTLPAKPIDVSAFSYSRRTTHQNPQSFLKRGTGNGGTVIPATSRRGSHDGIGSTATATMKEPGAKGKATPKKSKLRDFQVLLLADLPAHIIDFRTAIVASGYPSWIWIPISDMNLRNPFDTSTRKAHLEHKYPPWMSIWALDTYSGRCIYDVNAHLAETISWDQLTTSVHCS